MKKMKIQKRIKRKNKKDNILFIMNFYLINIIIFYYLSFLFCKRGYFIAFSYYKNNKKISIILLFIIIYSFLKFILFVFILYFIYYIFLIKNNL